MGSLKSNLQRNHHVSSAFEKYFIKTQFISANASAQATPSAFDTQKQETDYNYDQVQEPSADNKSAFRLTGYPIPASFNDELKQFKMISATKPSKGLFQQFTICMNDIDETLHSSKTSLKHVSYNSLKERIIEEHKNLDDPEFKG